MKLPYPANDEKMYQSNLITSACSCLKWKSVCIINNLEKLTNFQRRRLLNGKKSSNVTKLNTNDQVPATIDEVETGKVHDR